MWEAFQAVASVAVDRMSAAIPAMTLMLFRTL
jgi:hypothetical protein